MPPFIFHRPFAAASHKETTMFDVPHYVRATRRGLIDTVCVALASATILMVCFSTLIVRW